MADVLTLDAIAHSYAEGSGGRLHILHDVTLGVGAGEIVALTGKSGAGKSTLLHMAGLLDTPEKGRVLLNGTPVLARDDAARTLLRRQYIGFIYQFHHLLPEFSALENVMLPQITAGISRAVAQKRAVELLDKVKLSHRATHIPSQLSGGEQQRVAIARALANAPKLILADEPTGNLDPETAETVFAVLLDVIRSERAGALIATHNPELARRMDRTLNLDKGCVA